MRQVLIPSHLDPRHPALGGIVHSLEGDTMGTRWSVKLMAGRAQPGPGWSIGIQQQLDEVVAQMSSWDASSHLGRFNSAPAGSWHDLPAEFFEVLSFGLGVASATEGAYDPTAGALVNAWGFGPSRRFDEPGFVPPSDGAIASAMADGGWQRLEVDGFNRRIRQPGGMQLDLSSIAKGFAVDQVMSHLRRRGVESALVEVGGELCGIGLKPDGQPWWVALEPPDRRASAAGLRDTVVALHGISVATSGDYRRFFHQDGERRAHTLDPRSGRPVAQALASVSVVHPSCMAADAWSTALTVLGLERGMAVAHAQGLAARFVVRDEGGEDAPAGFTEHLSKPFSTLLS